MAATIEVGKSSYGRNTKSSTPYYELKYNQKGKERLVLRLAPPIKSAKDNGRGWFVYTPTHFGYTSVSSGRDGKTYSKMQTFSCIQRKNRDGEITQECPECTLIATRAQKLEETTKTMRDRGATQAQIDAVTKPTKDWLKAHNLSRKMKVLAKTQDGTWGVFVMGMKMFQALESVLMKLSESGKDALSPVKGLWLEFEVSGTEWNNLTYSVKPYMVEDADGALRYSFDDFTTRDYEQLDKAPELRSLNRTLTEDNIRTLVQADGDPEVVAQVFGLSQKVEKEESPTPLYTAAAQVALKEAAAAQSAPAQELDDAQKLAELQAQIALLQSRQGTVQAPTQAPAAKTAGATDASEEEAFFNQFS